MSAETIQSLRTELCDYIKQQREQLSLLSESLARSRRVPTPQTPVAASEERLRLRSEPIEVSATTKSFSSTSTECDQSPAVETKSCNLPAMPTADLKNETPFADQETDPMARLQAIKLRLAQQIANH